MMNFANLAPIPPLLQPLTAHGWNNKEIEVSMLRLDKIHPIISGNKLFKLSGHLRLLQQGNFAGVASCGGPFSNHLSALAFAARQLNIPSVAFVRGEKPAAFSPTLHDCADYGMEIRFVPRTEFAQPHVLQSLLPTHYWIDLGGYGTAGMEGFRWLLNSFNSAAYTHLITAVGSGTTLAALRRYCSPHQQIIGISSMKNNLSLQPHIDALLPEKLRGKYQIFHNYHFGGFAKTTTQLIAFMQTLYQHFQMPTDIVYTAKMVYGVFDLIEKGHFSAQTKILMLHGGGLQGNRSLPAETLPF